MSSAPQIWVYQPNVSSGTLQAGSTVTISGYVVASQPLAGAQVIITADLSVPGYGNVRLGQLTTTWPNGAQAMQFSMQASVPQIQATGQVKAQVLIAAQYYGSQYLSAQSMVPVTYNPAPAPPPQLTQQQLQAMLLPPQPSVQPSPSPTATYTAPQPQTTTQQTTTASLASPADMLSMVMQMLPLLLMVSMLSMFKI